MPNPRVVIVDDEESLRRLTRAVLERSGRLDVVAEASDGLEAVQVVTDHQPDLVLLDLMMPRMDGLQALPLIREAAPGAKVVILTGSGDGWEEATRAHGAVGYLQKGIPPQRLVHELLTLSGLLDEVEQAVALAITQLGPGPESARAARRFTDHALTTWNLERALDVVQLLVSEIVGNAIRHAGGALEARVRLLADSVRIGVVDASTELPVMREVSEYSESGRGLHLVDSLSQRWGTDMLHPGKQVWFEIPRWADDPDDDYAATGT